jgi:hypothetical protein
LYTDLVRRKIEKPLKRFDPSGTFRLGVLSTNPASEASDAPLAIVCEFDSAPRTDTLVELHRLAWNFCYSPLLATLEPGLLRAWNCCEKPADDTGALLLPPENLKLAEHAFGTGKPSLAEQAAHTLHWVNLITGDFLRRQEADRRVNPERRADRMLLDNLKFIRQRLLDMPAKGQRLSQDTCHDLLARVIFVQFLCERKDSAGNAALGPAQFAALHVERKLSQAYQRFENILANHTDTYELFRFLNRHFNGDLFPGKGLPRSQRKAAWQREMDEVQPEHLLEVAKLLDGRLQVENKQLCLWRHYSFDTIPLEFISSIYEEFVTKSKEALQEAVPSKSKKKKEGVVYTRGHLVDFVLDRVLPWGDTNWNVKVLDPACGSGIFLVKAFQRLMHRWRLSYPDQPIEPRFPRRLLERNLFGVDIDVDAVRVASFSLYLAMLDELDPKLYFRRTKFPDLFRRRLIAADFFEDSGWGFKTAPSERSRYDLVVGNAPWGEDMMTATAEVWAKTHHWPVADKNVGPLFLAKALTLTKAKGRVAMLEPAGALLVNYNSPEFRRRLFSEFKLEAVFNFSALSRVLFENADSPCTLTVLRPIPPDGEPFYYCSPKRQQSVEDQYRIVIEPHDGHWVLQTEVQTEDDIWPALMWGGRRELALARSLASAPSLAAYEAARQIEKREGIIRGSTRYEQIRGRRILEADDFPPRTFLRLNVQSLPRNDNPFVHRRTKLDAFNTPQLILKASWTKENQRFRAVVVEAPEGEEGAICNQSYISISARRVGRAELVAAALMFNSQLAVCLLLLTSGRFAFYRTEPLVADLMPLPLPPAEAAMLEGLTEFKQVDERVRAAFKLEDVEWALVEDLCELTLPDYRGDATSPGYQPTLRKLNPDRSHARAGMAEYCGYFCEVLRSGFGEEKSVCATVFEEVANDYLPVRLVAIHLDWPGHQALRSEPLSNQELSTRIYDLTRTLRIAGHSGAGDYQGCTARVYSFLDVNGRRIPTVFLMKPDQRRFWTRSMGVRDADAVSADIMTWLGTGEANTNHRPT